MDTKAVGNPAYIKEKSGIEVDLEMETTWWQWFVPKRENNSNSAWCDFTNAVQPYVST
jgi:hypothetical protein